MTHEDKGHYAKKHPPDRKVRPEVVDALKKQISDRGISCFDAHKVADDLKESPAEVGVALDFLEVPIIGCQLGLFGYRPEKKIVRPAEIIPQGVEEAIRKNLVRDRLSCKCAWELAGRFGVKRIEIASTCETLKIKISPCQLGAF